MEKSRLIPCGAKEFTLKIGSYERGRMAGTLLHPRLAGEAPFESFIGLAVMMEDLMDLEDCPGAEAPTAVGSGGIDRPIATFRIEVLFRQNHSWQGRLIWQEQRQEANFRSALELILLLDEILAV